jgi:putative ABC transport system permease protein
MALVPVSYNLRSLLVRRSATVLTVLGVGATVAVLAGVLALQQGFAALFTSTGRDDVLVLLRPGAGNEGMSGIDRKRADVLLKSIPEIASDPDGRPLASAETFLAVRRFKVDGGEVNVPIRGVQPRSFEIYGDAIRITQGERFRPGHDEVIVGSKLPGHIRDCRLGDVIVLNTTPFRVAGVFEHDGAFASEVWGDIERMSDALERPFFNRIVAKLRPGVSVESFKERVKKDHQAPADAFTEREYLLKQTEAMSVVFGMLGGLLAVVMGIAAVFTATNTMLSALAARTHEIGVLKALGFRPVAIFVSFLFESTVLGLLGGAIGCLLVLPIHGAETGTMNFNSFTEVAFAFRITPEVLVTAVCFALVLGLLGGAWPAWRAARLIPQESLRRR